MSNQDLFYVIRDKKTGEEIERFTGMSERGYRGLMMKVDSKRFKVDIHASAKTADEGTVKAIAAADAKRQERRDFLKSNPIPERV